MLPASFSTLCILLSIYVIVKRLDTLMYRMNGDSSLIIDLALSVLKSGKEQVTCDETTLHNRDLGLSLVNTMIPSYLVIHTLMIDRKKHTTMSNLLDMDAFLWTVSGNKKKLVLSVLDFE